MPPEKDGRVSRSDESSLELARSQREANEELVLSSLRAHEATEAAEAREEELLAMAELRERLLGMLGHDLRNPLNAMLTGAAFMVRRGKLCEGDVQAAERILRSGHRMERMISQLLDFTRVRLGGGLLLDLRPSNLGDVCRSVSEELELGTSVRVDCVVEGDMTGSWDVDRVSEVISNVAGNAIDHAKAGTCVALHAYDEGADVVVEIANEGPPIPPAMLPFIFEPFRRARQRKTSTGGNLGLGLYIAKEVVHAHGGTIDARCAEGKTTFTVHLPHCPPRASQSAV
jgi:signal transduction histidine kinase